MTPQTIKRPDVTPAEAGAHFRLSATPPIDSDLRRNDDGRGTPG